MNRHENLGTAVDSLAQQTVEPISASFRDPSGFVFVRDGVLYRQVNRCYQPHYDHFVKSGLAAELMEKQLLIQHEERPTADASDAAYKLLRPERVPFISYPYEWCFSELRDAALLTLRIQARALKFGMSLKDASAYNIQFLRGRPILIDTLSFELYEEGRPWVAYRQFCQHFVGPLALMAYRDVHLSQLLRVYIDGVPLDMTSGLLPWRTRFKPSLAMHVHLHARLQRSHSNRRVERVRQRQMSRSALVGFLESLATLIRGLRWAPEGTEWADYYSDTNYSSDALSAKERIVAQMINSVTPTSVWDLGANTGRFSRLGSRHGVMTMAFDVDPAAVEKNYLQSVASSETHLLPLVLDLSNPSPALGWAGEERLSLEQRGPADVVLALALVHHLAIGNNLPLSKVADFFARLTNHLIIEFVPKADSQVQRLLASRVDIFGSYTQPAFEEAFGRRFLIKSRNLIPDTQRTLYLMQRT